MAQRIAVAQLEGFAEAEQHLAKVVIDVRGPMLRLAMRQAGMIVVNRARQLTPPPGAPGTAEDWQPMRDRLSVDAKEITNGMLAIIGPRKYAKSRHGHLVEFGHDMVVGGTTMHKSKGKTYAATTNARFKLNPARTGKGRKVGEVPPYPFLEPAAKETLRQQSQLLLEKIKAIVDKALATGKYRGKSVYG